MGIIPNIHHKPYLPIQKEQQFLEFQNVKHHTQRKHQAQRLKLFLLDQITTFKSKFTCLKPSF